ncbi:hypothetical protein [Streptomyces sp. NPDC001930]|uniref:imine reductase family protein n=1 Tax=Streptomyces sp. NPDC001930 TaxID=3364625 RepID=UPI003677EB09
MREYSTLGGTCWWTSRCTRPLASILAGAAHDKALGEEANVDTTWIEPLNDLLRRAVAAGHGGHSIAALTEVLSGEASTGARCSSS